MIRIEHNVETGEVQEINLTKSEIDFATSETKEIQQLVTELKIKAESKAQARKAILDKLGLTAQEAAELLS